MGFESPRSPKMKLHFTVFVVCAALALCSLNASGQQTAGQINGTIFDSQGAALPNAEISVVEQNTSLTRRAVSTGAGTYSLPFLPPGTYTLTTKAKGFATIQ